MLRTVPPFRADHVGSLLRPAALLSARERRVKGELSAEALRAQEDEAIRHAVALQEQVGLQGITDGEYRRAIFHVDFLKCIQGVTVSPGTYKLKFRGAEQPIDFAPPVLAVSGRLQRPAGGIVIDDFQFLNSVTQRTAKVCIPSPSMLHFRGGRAQVDRQAYPDMDEFFADLARVYREEIAGLYAAGCRYVQLDDTNLAYLCDPAHRERARSIGEDPEQLPQLYADLINDSIRERPADMKVCVHLCRGNFRSAWVAEGGYEAVAETLFNHMTVDGFFLEYDDTRSGDFAPLRFVPKGKMVVLGLITSKRAELEAKDAIKRRVEDATGYLDLDSLALSPQCGFSSSEHGNALTEAQEIEKLRLVVELAQEIWGEGAA